MRFSSSYLGGVTFRASGLIRNSCIYASTCSAQMRENAARGTWQTVELNWVEHSLLMATCSSCGLTLTWSVAAGAVFYRLVMLKFCGVALMQAASKQQQQQQQQKGQQQRNVICKFQWHFGCCCALDLLLLLSLCPFVLFWATLSPCDVWGLAATLAPAFGFVSAPCCACAVRFAVSFCILCGIYCRSSSSSPPLTSPSPALAPWLQCVGCPTSRFVSLLHHMTYEWFMFMAPLQARWKALRNYVYAMLQDIWMCI